MIKLIDILKEIKIKDPIGIHKVSMEKFIEALIVEEKKTAEELGYTNAEYLDDFIQKVKNIKKISELGEIYGELGYGVDEIFQNIQNIFIKE